MIFDVVAEGATPDPATTGPIRTVGRTYRPNGQPLGTTLHDGATVRGERRFE